MANHCDAGVSKLRAYAKINLGLRILGRRRDGFHYISSVFQTLDLFDVLAIQFPGVPGGSLAVHVDHPGVPGGEGNLITRALQHFDLPDGALVGVRKRIPVGGGLGGGSADAAAILGFLRERCSVKGHRSTDSLASDLGADVSFFLRGGTAEIRGVGEEVSSLPPVPPLWALLFYPGLGCDTGRVYSAFDAMRIPPGQPLDARALVSALESLDPEEIDVQLRNDLEAAAVGSYPALGHFREMLRSRLGAPAVMTGSGSCFYSLYKDRERMLHDLARVRWDVSFGGGRTMVSRFRRAAAWEHAGGDGA